MRQSPIPILTLLLLPAAAAAHPLPKDNHDRTLVVRVTPTALVVDYRLEVDELRAARDLPAAVLRSVRDRDELHQRFLDFFADVLANNLDAKLDGRPLTFRCIGRSLRVLDHLRCDYRFAAEWSPADGPHALAFRDGNYERDDFSLQRLTLAGENGVELRDVVAPDEALMARPPDERGPGDGERLRRASGRLLLRPAHLPAVFKPGLPPDPEAARGGPERPADAAVAKTNCPDGPLAPRPGPDQETATAKTYSLPAAESAPAVPESPSADRPASGSRRLLDLLLDTRLGLGLLLLLAAAFGAAHALTPGHGKTLVAAYLVGERGTAAHAVLLGVVVTLTHTSAVLILAVVLWLAFPDRTPPGLQTVLGLVGGLLIAGLGAWLLLQRLAGRADHIHIGGGHHHHHHGHDHVHVPEPGEKVRWGGLVTLGVSGGLVPCWDAVGMLLFAISANRLRLALPLLLSFSGGLAGVLVALGIGVVWARNAAVSHWGRTDRLGRWLKALPLCSAAAVTVLGLWLCYDSVHGGH